MDNRMKRTVGLLLAVLLLMGMTLTACGGNNSATTGTNESSGTGGSSSGSNNSGTGEEKIELRVGTWQTEESATAILNQAKVSFEAKYPNVTVKIEASPYENYLTKLQTELAAGSPPDLIQVGEQNFARYLRKDIIVDLTPYMEGDYDVNDIVPNVRELMTVDGKIPVMSIGGATIGVYYNKKLFDAANVPYPQEGWTWEDFVELAEKLTIRDGNKIVQYGANLNLAKDWVEPFVVGNGGSYLSPDGQTAAGHLDSDATVEAFRKISDLYNVSKVAPNPAELTALKGIDLFATGQVAMNVNGSWAQADLRNNPDIEFGVVPLPTMSTGKLTSLLYTSGFGISSKSNHKDLAWKFLYELTSPDTEAGQGWAAFNLAVSQKLAETTKQNEDPYIGVFIDQLNYAIESAYFLNPYWGSIGDKLLTPAIEEIVLEPNLDIKAKMGELVERINFELQQAAE
jgi:multiple sugar transport system substrate-binding protein